MLKTNLVDLKDIHLGKLLSGYIVRKIEILILSAFVSNLSAQLFFGSSQGPKKELEIIRIPLYR